MLFGLGFTQSQTNLDTDPVSPISFEIQSPIAGSTVSGMLNFNIRAHSTEAPIEKIEIYEDGILIKTMYLPQPPEVNVKQ